MERFSLRNNHVVALAAIVIGYPVLVELFLVFGVFEFLGPEYTYNPFWENEKAAFIKACNRGFQCEFAIAAFNFVPLVIVARGVRRLFDGEPYASTVHPRTLKSVHFIVCFILIWGGWRYVVGPFFGLFTDPEGLFSPSERWRYLPGVVVVEYLAEFVAACIATRHAIRIREYREEAPEPDADG